MLLNEIKPLMEKMIPASKPIDYSWNISSDNISTDWIKISEKTRLLMEMSRVPVKISPLGQSILIDKSITNFKMNNSWEFGFDTEINKVAQDGFRKKGDFNKEVFKVMSTVAYGIYDLIYNYRSKFDLFYFWSRDNENKESSYAKLANELTDQIKNMSFISVNAKYIFQTVPGREDSYHTWIKRTSFKDLSYTLLEHPELFN
jgi:hypothetical protein